MTLFAEISGMIVGISGIMAGLVYFSKRFSKTPAEIDQSFDQASQAAKQSFEDSGRPQ